MVDYKGRGGNQEFVIIKSHLNAIFIFLKALTG